MQIINNWINEYMYFRTERLEAYDCGLYKETSKSDFAWEPLITNFKVKDGDSKLCSILLVRC